MRILGPLLFALIAALGNGMFVAGQKKAIVFENQFSFISLSVIVVALLTLLFAPIFGPTNYVAAIRENSLWAILSGGGLFLTYLGFNLLYSNYGASNYILYAVLSIITTSIIVGVIMFRETFNIYHWIALFLSILTVIFFTIGNNLSISST